MYAILVSFALAVYSVILVDFSLLFQEISVNADLLNSTQALYAAEGEIERTWNQIQTGDLAQRNILMLAAADQSAPQSDEDFLPGGEGLEAFYLNKTLDPAGEDLSAAPAFHPYNRVVQQGVYLADGQALDHLAYYGLEPRSEKTFSFRETSPEGNFNQLVLDYNQGMEAEDMMLDVFAFPKDGLPLELPDFDQLKEGAEGPIRRQTLNTRDETQNGSFLDLGGHLLGVGFGQVLADDA